MNFDTRDPKAMLTLTHGCIEGLPCTPPAAELYNAQAGGSHIHVTPNVIPNNKGATIDVGSSLGLILLNLVLVTFLIVSCCYNCKLRRQLKKEEQGNNGINDEHEERVVSGGMEDVDADVDAPRGNSDYVRLAAEIELNHSGNHIENDNEDKEAAVENTIDKITSTTPLLDGSEVL